MSEAVLSGDILHLVATLDQEQSRGVLLALYEAILLAQGKTPPEGVAGAVERLDRQRAERAREWEQAAADVWLPHGDTGASRRDGVDLVRGWPSFFAWTETDRLEAQHSRQFWTVRFPPTQGGAPPVFVVEGETLAAAAAAVDARWPMPSWWASLDAQSEALEIDLRRVRSWPP